MFNDIPINDDSNGCVTLSLYNNLSIAPLILSQVTTGNAEPSGKPNLPFLLNNIFGSFQAGV